MSFRVYFGKNHALLEDFYLQNRADSVMHIIIVE